KSPQLNSSLFSFMSVAIILLTFFVGISSDRRHKVINQPAIQLTEEIGLLENNPEQSAASLLQFKLNINEIFRANSANLTAEAPFFAEYISSLLTNRSAKVLIIINGDSQKDSLSLTLTRAATLHRLLLDNHIPDQFLRIITQEASTLDQIGY